MLLRSKQSIAEPKGKQIIAITPMQASYPRTMPAREGQAAGDTSLIPSQTPFTKA